MQNCFNTYKRSNHGLFVLKVLNSSYYLVSKKSRMQYFFCYTSRAEYLTMLHQFSSASQSCPTLGLHGLQHFWLTCLSPTPGACSNSCPSSQWCLSTISSSIVPFSSCLQSFPVSGSFPMSPFFALGGQSIGNSASTSVLPMNTRD